MRYECVDIGWMVYVEVAVCKSPSGRKCRVVDCTVTIREKVSCCGLYGHHQGESVVLWIVRSPSGRKCRVVDCTVTIREKVSCCELYGHHQGESVVLWIVRSPSGRKCRVVDCTVTIREKVSCCGLYSHHQGESVVVWIVRSPSGRKCRVVDCTVTIREKVSCCGLYGKPYCISGQCGLPLYFISLKMTTWLTETCRELSCVCKLILVYLCAFFGTIIVMFCVHLFVSVP
jgi:hypothetical protein